MICACVAAFQTALAQRITRQYNNVSFSEALKDLNARQHKYTINFVYDELEDFRVTKSIRNQSVPDAIMQLVGFYPIRMTQVEDNIMVECTQKTPTKMIGRIIDYKNRPVDFANKGTGAGNAEKADYSFNLTGFFLCFFAISIFFLNFAAETL